MNRRHLCLKPIAPAFLFAAVVAGSFLAAPADIRAESPADKIAEKFSGADAKPSQSAAQAEEERIRAEARRAVERALAKEASTESAVETAVEKPGLAARSDEQTRAQPTFAEEVRSIEPSSQPAASVAPETFADSGEADPVPAAPASDNAPMSDSPTQEASPVEATDPVSPNAEAEALKEKLRAVRREREIELHQTQPAEPPAAQEEPGIVSQVVSKFATQAAEYISPLVEKHVSVLLVMEVGKTGVRRWSKTADPMLCIHENCYISEGAAKPAQKLSRDKAFGPTVALGKRGGACRSKPACIFRDIDLETVEAKLQPIDLKFLHHDRREAQPIRADTTCAIIEGKLSCRSPVEGKSWKAWIVPESVAKRAGAKGLERALEEGLE